ncbi:MAG: beta-ketoacyl synthase N-terminal-like domain-containing protein [Planctomycetaceae bacterium]
MPDTSTVITGVGLVTPFGTDLSEISQAVAKGESGLKWLAEPPVAQERKPGLYAGGRAKFEPTSGQDAVVEMAVVAAQAAILDAGIDLGSIDRTRLGCVVGTSKGLLDTYADDFISGHRAVAFPGFQPNTPAIHVAQSVSATGPCLCPIAACATGLASVARGVQLIDDGYCDVVLAGSSDASLCDWVLNSFSRLGVLAKNFDDPAHAVRPFSDDRDGFLVGEGAAVFVLQKEHDAIAAGSNVRARWLASATGSDPTGITQIDETGEALEAIISMALSTAGILPKEVDFLNLHGTATKPNDLCEGNAIRAIFGDRAIQRRAYKSQIGHCLGAAGSIEIGLSLLEPDWTTQLKTSLGFGGHLIAAALERPR